MHRIILILLFFPFIIYSQLADYELEFTSFSQDYLEMQNTSSAIANSNAFSVSAWVNPQSNTNHGGIVGFRNNIDADFYLLQLQNTNNVEARFRNSTGVNYDIIANGILDFNQWQHLTFTYDGSYIRLYKNGIIVDSTVASGNIMQSAESLRVGSLNYQGLEFYFIGRIDEVRLWKVCLSSTEISNWMCAEIDQAHPDFINLMGYWRLNEGQGIIAYDQTNANDGTLINAVATYQNATSCFASSVSLPKTYVPDDNFEAYLEANGMGDGIALNDSVFTSAIDTVLDLDVYNQSIADLTGIEDFSGLIALKCAGNQLTSLNVAYNTALELLSCSGNQLTSLDIINNDSLVQLYCNDNQITFLNVSNNSILQVLAFSDNQVANIDLSQNSALWDLYCSNNLLTELDVSHNGNLAGLSCPNNPNLVSLDIRNGNNINMLLEATSLPSIFCIDVDDVAWSTANWTVANLNIDSQHYFSNDCSVTNVKEYIINQEYFKEIDLLGREIKAKKNQFFFYIYDDGAVEKKMILE